MNQNVILTFKNVQFSTVMSEKVNMAAKHNTWVPKISFSSTLNQNIFKYVMGGGGLRVKRTRSNFHTSFYCDTDLYRASTQNNSTKAVKVFTR